jgi:Glycosyl hydrolases family 2, sugar binding domain/Glycosyl hydrolases family 2/Glycosyl hydrolases family 2, TIM barrel domain
MKHFRSILIISCLTIMQINKSGAQDWKPVLGNIMTSWAAGVTPDNVWKEYPRPQMVRKEWKNLNGLWDFALSIGTNNKPPQVYTRKILVPFCVESALSGIKETVRGSQEMMYRRFFTIPETWRGKRVLLHLEAVDYYARLWIDGKFIGEHKGGYDSFQFDITNYLSTGENHEINLVVWDPSNEGTQPVGKQTVLGLSRGRYTATSGIWQTVWLEPVEEFSVNNLKILPDLDNGTVTVQAGLKGWGSNPQIKVQVLDNGTEVVSGTGSADKAVTLNIKNAKLWSPEIPFLYDLKVSLMSDDKTIDEVGSYFGMRKISTGRDAAGLMRIYLNYKEIFQLGPLDQGYWPDGILLPASDEGLKYDVEYLKKIGCNMDRIHIKVQPERFYYYCDKLGLLLWQDMISPWSSFSRSEIGGAKDFETMWEKIIDQLYSHPSIIQWTVFNEGWVQYDTERLTDWTKKKDPSRLVSNASGWIDRHVGDVRDFHDYTFYPSIAWVPENYPRPMVIGEGGGFDLTTKEHLWNPELVMPEKVDRAGDLNRETVGNPNVLDERYNSWIDNIAILRNYGLNAVVYTQISDVENEVNGWMTYDRKVSKIPEERLAAIHSKLFKPLMQGQTILPLSMNKPQSWQFSFTEPAKEWFKKGNTGKWSTGNAPFGTSQMYVPEVNTKWTAPGLYLQKEFSLKSISAMLSIIIYNTGVTDVYINGELAVQINNLKRNDSELKMSEVFLPDKAMKLLKSGSNHIAVKFAFTPMDQALNYFDMGLNEY